MTPKNFSLIAPQPIWSYDPDSFRDYIRSLRDSYLEHEAKKRLKRAAKKPTALSLSPITGVTFSLNTKGNPVIRISRKPQYLIKSEIITIAKSLGLPQNTLWVKLSKRKVPIYDSHPQTIVRIEA